LGKGRVLGKKELQLVVLLVVFVCPSLLLLFGSGGWWVVGGDLFCRDQEEEVMAMAKVFCKTPSKSGGKVGKWERCPLKDCISPEPAVKSKTPGRPVCDDSLSLSL
jgi:hypothetical protein